MNPLEALSKAKTDEINIAMEKSRRKTRKEARQNGSAHSSGSTPATGPKQGPYGLRRNWGEKRIGQVLYCSDGSARTVSRCWQDLFDQNEKWMLPDTDLVQIMLKLWPDRAVSKNLYDVNRIRGQYNRGKLPGMTSIPEKSSRKFLRAGQAIYVTNARGKVKGAVYEPRKGPDPMLVMQATGSMVDPYRDGAGKSMCEVQSEMVEGPDGPLFAVFHSAQKNRSRTQKTV